MSKQVDETHKQYVMRCADLYATDAGNKVANREALEAALEAALKPTQEPIGYVHPEALKRIQNGETVAFRKKPYVGEATLAVFLSPAQTPPRLTDGQVISAYKAGSTEWQEETDSWSFRVGAKWAQDTIRKQAGWE